MKRVFQDKRYKNREREIVLSLNHPNIVGCKEDFESKGEKVEQNSKWEIFCLKASINWKETQEKRDSFWNNLQLFHGFLLCLFSKRKTKFISTWLWNTWVIHCQRLFVTKGNVGIWWRLKILSSTRIKCSKRYLT